MVKVGKKYIVETNESDKVMTIVKCDGGLYTLKADDGSGFVETDWLEFFDQASLGRIKEYNRAQG